MTRSPTFVRAALGCIVLAGLLAANAVPAAVLGEKLQAERVAWQELRFGASKLLVSAEAGVTLERLQGGEVLVVLESKVLGRTSESRLWLDAETARASREEKLKVRDRAELRSYTYGSDHALKERYHERAPEAADEPAETWVVKGSERQDYPGDTPQSVTSPSALLYVLASSSLAAAGDLVDVRIFTDRRLVTARAEAVERTTCHQLRLVADSGAKAYRPQNVLRVRLTGRDPSGGAVDLGLFGLEGDLEILLDADRRLPLAVKGDLPIFGKISVLLEEARLRPGEAL